MMDVAIGWADRGYQIFPCSPFDKKPLTPRDRDPKTGELIPGTGGLKKASCNVDQIRAWWKQNPEAMIGLPTGDIISAFVLEIDIADKAGNSYTSVAAQIATVEAELGVPLPPTWRVRTPRGGEHWFYWSKHGYPKNSASIVRGGKELRGIDIRGTGGYVIAAGSRRHDGKLYTTVGHIEEPAEAPVEPLTGPVRAADGHPRNPAPLHRHPIEQTAPPIHPRIRTRLTPGAPSRARSPSSPPHQKADATSRFSRPPPLSLTSSPTDC
jgi:putative DNA primase/helicase